MIKSILVTLDGSGLAEQALPHAVALARLYDARLTLTRVPETLVVPVASAGIWITRETEPHESREHAASYLAEVAERPLLAGLDVDTVLPRHPVVAGLLEAITSAAADLVVLTTHGHSGITRMLLGSVASKLVHHAPTDVFVVPAHGVPSHDAPDHPVPAEAVPAYAASPEEPPAIGTIVVPLDGSANGELALPVAADVAQRTNAALRLMRVPTVPAYLTVIADSAAMIPSHLQQRALEAEIYLAEQAHRLAEAGLEVAADVEVTLEGGVDKAIEDYCAAQGADLVILCSHGQSGIARMILGSVADRVLRRSKQPVWIVRPEHGAA